jgi:pimeloyl-ACP methyl ester carboxylesterase
MVETAASPHPGAPWLPPGRKLKLGRRGTTFIRELDGPPGAPTVLLLHGWTVDADVNWFQCYRPLSQRFRVIAMDHRGHGRGIRSIRPFRLEDCADDIAALVAELATGPVIPVGYSMGGPIAQLTWRRHPDVVDGLVLCATSRKFASRDPRTRLLFGSMLGLSAGARLVPAAVRRQLMDQVMGRRLSEADPLAQWVMTEVRRNDMSAVLQAGYAIGSFDSRPWLGEIDVPAAVVVTELDRLVGPRYQRDLAAAMPSATVHPVRGDHGACVMNPGQFVPALIRACDSVASRARSRVG